MSAQVNMKVNAHVNELPSFTPSFGCRMRIRAVAATLFVSIAGCVSPAAQIENGKRALETSERIVTTVGEVRFDPVSLGEPVRFSLDQRSTVLAEPSGRRFVKGFRLPSTDTPLQIELASFLGGTLAEPIALYVEAVVLDASFRAIESIAPRRPMRNGFFGRDSISAQFFINDRARRPTYLLVTERRVEEADLLRLERNYVGTSTVAVGAAMVPITIGRDAGAVMLRAAPTGDLAVRFVEYRPATLGGR